MDTVSATSDERTVNNAGNGNAMRHNYRVLSEDEKVKMAAIKSCGQELLDIIISLGGGREYSIAYVKTEEAVMWAVKGLTA